MSGQKVPTGSLRVAVVGSGPAGLYAATDLLKREPEACVDLFDRLPTPGGLARSGVSPDHAVRRQVIEFYERLAVASGRYRFFGHVAIGRDLTHEDLQAGYHAVIYACGASGDRRLGIPGEDLAGSHAATEFVAWYNAHPDYADRRFDLGGERAVVVGNGNVALDVARMLLLGPERLRHTDIADHALAALSASRIREVVILGRRGAAQAAFSAPELMELAQLDDVDIVVESAGDAVPETADGGRRLRWQLIDEYAQRGVRGRPRRLVLRFLTSPVELLGSGRVEAVRVVRNTLTSGADGGVRAQPTGDVEDLAAGLVLRSVGYRGRPVGGLPFDEESGTMPNLEGRVVDAAGACVPGVYVVGWLKRGPSGVIGSNKVCAQQTIQRLLEDHGSRRLPAPQRSEAQDRVLAQRQVRHVDFAAWKAIDRHERARGTAQNRPRNRYASIDEMLSVALAQ